jgi:hypothetical protein
MYYTGAAAVSDSVLTLDPLGEMTRSGEDGRFSLPIHSTSTVSLRAAKQGDFRSAVTSLDAVYILQHVVGDRQLSDRERLACDVTGDGQVSALDATRVLELAVGELQRFPRGAACASDWIFAIDGAPLSCDHPLQVDPGAPLQVEALLAGDCTGNWEGDGPVARQLGPSRVRSQPRVRIGRPRGRGARVLLPIYIRASKPYLSLDLSVAYEAAELRPTRVRVLGTRSGGFVRWNLGAAGSVRVAVANPEGINRSRRQALVVEFEALSDTPGSVAVERVLIDEQAPRVSRLRR